MLVMYGGSVVESGRPRSVFANRMHPYTLGLFGARPGLGAPRGRRLATIPGTVPELVDLPPGLPVRGPLHASRFPSAMSRCRRRTRSRRASGRAASGWMRSAAAREQAGKA
jgi:peptide/nickel transport system ATP-binding protein